MANLDNAKIYKKVSKTGAVADQYAVVNLDATDFCVTLDNQVYTISNRFNYVDNNYVSLTRSETIQGLKTFERRPRVTVGAVQYTYLQSQGYSVLGTACPYIDTGIKLTSTQNMLVEYDVEITSNEAAFIAGVDGATGVGSNDSNYWYLGTSASTSSVNTHTRQTIYELIRITSTTKRAAILNSSLTEIGARTGASIATYAMNTTYPIFAIKNNSDTVLQNNSKHSAGAKIYSVKIYVGAPESASELRTSAYLVAEYIPAKLGEANGFYDNVNHYFITSSNVYAFDIGEEVGPIDSSYENVALMSDLPAVGEGTLTIQRNGVYQGQFNANTVADATINIEVPTTLNDLTGWSTIGTSPVDTVGISTVVNESSTDSQIPTARAVRLAIQNLAPNQDAWSYIKVGNATISAASETDTFEVAAGTAATVAADTTNKKVTIGVSLGTGASQAAKGDHNHDSVYSKLGHNHDSAYAALGHTHTTSLNTSTATPSITLDYSGKYAITAGGTTYTFQMPAQYSLPSASASAYGGVKVGYTTSGKNYKLQLDSSGNAYVNVPWSDTNYYHTAGSWSNYAYTLTGNGGAGNITITLPTVVSTIGVAATGLYVATNGGVTTTIGSVIGTTAVSTKAISTNSASIASGNTDLVTGGAIYSYVENEGGKVKSLTVGSTNYTPTNGVITIPAYPSVSDSTITIKQDGQSDQTFTLNGGTKTISLADTNTWRPIGTGATDAAAGNHGHTSFNGLLINTQTNTTPFNISRTGNLAENVAYSVDDTNHYITYTNDETSSSIRWTLINTDTETGGGASASTHTMALSSSNGGMSLSIDGTAVSLNGHTHSQYLTSQSNDFGKIKVGSTTTTASAIQDVITFAASGDLGVSISGKTITYSVTLPTELPASDVSAWAKAANKPTYTASEVGALPSTTSFLASVSKSGNTYTITNSAGSKTSWTIPTTLPASDVSAWAKAANKPTYTWTEIDNKPTTFTPSAHNHPLTDITGVATIGTTSVSTSTITYTIGSSTSSTNIPTEGAIVAALSNVSIKPTVNGDTIIFK